MMCFVCIAIVITFLDKRTTINLGIAPTMLTVLGVSGIRRNLHVWPQTDIACSSPDGSRFLHLLSNQLGV